jgi:hypothetical protein
MRVQRGAGTHSPRLKGKNEFQGYLLGYEMKYVRSCATDKCLNAVTQDSDANDRVHCGCPVCGCVLRKQNSIGLVLENRCEYM